MQGVAGLALLLVTPQEPRQAVVVLGVIQTELHLQELPILVAGEAATDRDPGLLILAVREVPVVQVS